MNDFLLSVAGYVIGITALFAVAFSALSSLTKVIHKQPYTSKIGGIWAILTDQGFISGATIKDQNITINGDGAILHAVTVMNSSVTVNPGPHGGIINFAGRSSFNAPITTNSPRK